MSFLSPTSSNLLTGDVEVPELANAPVDSQEAPITSDRNVEGALEAFDPNVSMGFSAMEHLSPETHNILLPSPIMSEHNDGSAESSNSHILTGSPEMEADWDNSDLESSDISTGSSEMETDWDDSVIESSGPGILMGSPSMEHMSLELQSTLSQSPLPPHLVSEGDSGDRAYKSSSALKCSRPAMENWPFEIRKLVCKACWSTVFAADEFHKAWEAQNVDRFMKEPFGFLYETPTWKRMWHQYWGVQIHNNKKFKIEVCFCKEALHLPHLVHGSRLSLMLRAFEGDLKTEESLFGIHAAYDDPAARFIDHRPVLLDVDSPLVYSLIKERIDDCLLHECCCRSQNICLPIRVIDCKDPNYPRLFISNGMEANYTVLSYVWGCKSQPHCTTTQNLESYINGIPLANIPKTIMDAITVTRKIGLQYLWVDAFCILQDSKNDKAQEINKIWYIFCDAYVAIIAACADSVNDGFLHVRSEKTKSWSLGEIISLPFLCPDEWTSNLPNLTSVSDQALSNSNSSVNNEMRNIWESILEMYTTRKVTKPRDRLIAFSGIVEHFQEVWPDSKYIAGLWSHQLPESLLWCSCSSFKPRPQCYCAPSWSWASVDSGVEDFSGPQSRYGMVHLEDMDEGQDYKYAICVVQFCDAETNTHGEVTNGCLILDAIVWQAVWDPVQKVLTDIASVRTYHSAKISPLVSEKGVTEHGMGTVSCDAAEPISQEIGEVYLAIVTASSEGLVGLVLVPATNKITNTQEDAYTDSFRRVGVFGLRIDVDVDDTWKNSEEYQHIKII
ncbi:heterokaryon incompatibility protein-domain-containing protein [Armillaria nabsnona]|nr:heterokaryon incompatibility protein-domain-containing protein [Armillaria nabsnona]